MAAVGLEVGAVFMAGGEEASTAEVACARAAEAGSVAEGALNRPAEGVSAAGRIRHLRLEAAHPIQRPVLQCGLEGARFSGPATTVLDRAVVSRAGISGLEIPPRRLLLSPTVGGIHSAARVEAVDLRAPSRKLGPQAARGASTPLAGTANRHPPARSVAFRGKAAKSGRTPPWREISFPSLN